MLRLAFGGMQPSSYQEDIQGKFTEAEGAQKYALLELQPIQMNASWTSSVADVVAPGSAVLFRKYGKDGMASGFGYRKPLDKNNRVSYVYQEDNNWSTPTARSRTMGETGFTDWIAFPDRKITPGYKWRSRVRISLDDVRPAVIENAKASSVFEGLEWEQGVQCAKIVTTIAWDTGGAEMDFPTTDQYSLALDSFSGTVTSFVSLRTSRVVKVIEDLSFKGQFLGTLTTPGGTTGGNTGGPGYAGGYNPPPNNRDIAPPTGLAGASGGGGGGGARGGAVAPPGMSGPGSGGGRLPQGAYAPGSRPGSGGLTSGGGGSSGSSGSSGSKDTATRTKVTFGRKIVTKLLIR